MNLCAVLGIYWWADANCRNSHFFYRRNSHLVCVYENWDCLACHNSVQKITLVMIPFQYIKHGSFCTEKKKVLYLDDFAENIFEFLYLNFLWGILLLCLASSRNMKVIKFSHETSMTLKLIGQQRSLCVGRVWGCALSASEVWTLGCLLVQPEPSRWFLPALISYYSSVKFLSFFPTSRRGVHASRSSIFLLTLFSVWYFSIKFSNWDPKGACTIAIL